MEPIKRGENYLGKINELIDRVNILTKIWERCHGGVYKMVEDQAIKEIKKESQEEVK